MRQDGGVTDPAKPPTTVRLTRTALGRYTATNAAGVSIELGHADELFSPVELLLAAVGGCSAIDVDYVTARRSEPETFHVEISSVKTTDESGGHRLGEVTVDFRVTFPDTEDGRSAADVVTRSVRQSRDRLCTVSRTVQHPTPVTYHVDGQEIS